MKDKRVAVLMGGFSSERPVSLASGKPCLLCRRMLRNAMLDQVIYLETDGSVVCCAPKDIRD